MKDEITNTYFNLESDRLKFRKLTEEDIPTWTKFFENNDRLKFLGIDISKTPQQLATEWIQMQYKRYENQGLGHLAAILKDTGEFIGVGGVLPRAHDELRGERQFEIAYSLKKEFWGKGYATELAQTMRDYGFKNVDTGYLISIIDQNNSDSAAVAQRNGMRVLYQTFFMGMNVNVYGIHKNEWKALSES